LKKAPNSTTRGVFVVDKSGKVLAAEPGSPAGTVEVVKKLVGDRAVPVLAAAEEPKAEAPVANGTTDGDTKEDVAQADVGK